MHECRFARVLLTHLLEKRPLELACEFRSQLRQQQLEKKLATRRTATQQRQHASTLSYACTHPHPTLWVCICVRQETDYTRASAATLGASKVVDTLLQPHGAPCHNTSSRPPGSRTRSFCLLQVPRHDVTSAATIDLSKTNLQELRRFRALFAMSAQLQVHDTKSLRAKPSNLYESMLRPTRTK